VPRKTWRGPRFQTTFPDQAGAGFQVGDPDHAEVEIDVAVDLGPGRDVPGPMLRHRRGGNLDAKEEFDAPKKFEVEDERTYGAARVVFLRYG